MNEEVPNNNIGSGAIVNPNNRLLGGKKLNYKENNEKYQNILKKWIKDRCSG
jgi:hypothetical protein